MGCSASKDTVSITPSSSSVVSPPDGILTASIIFVVAPPAVGKGTQCTRIKERFGYVHLSTGDLLREEVAKGTALGKQASAVMAAGGLVSDDLVLELLHSAIVTAPANSKFLIDGYPRSLPQAIAFEKKVGKPSFILSFTASDEALLARVLERGRTSGRSDDNAEAFKSRLATFRSQSQPVLDFYAQHDAVRMINANRSIDEVFADVAPLFVEKVDSVAHASHPSTAINAAFVFIKPHANTVQVQALVTQALSQKVTFFDSWQYTVSLVLH